MKLSDVYEYINENRKNLIEFKKVSISKCYKDYFQISLMKENNKSNPLKEIHYEIRRGNKENEFVFWIHFEELNTVRYQFSEELNKLVDNNNLEFVTWWDSAKSRNKDNKSLRRKESFFIDSQEGLKSFLDFLYEFFSNFNDILIDIYKSKGNNMENLKDMFRKWLKEIKMSSSVQSNYPLYVEKYIPEILASSGIECSNLFHIDKLSKLEEILNLFNTTDDLKKVNTEKKHYPVSSLKKYIDFLKTIVMEERKPQKDSIKIKNIMLYGAPGVGKTYNYKKLVSLIEGGDFKENEIFDFIINNNDDEIEEGSVEKLYKTIKKEERIEFVTFHQSYSYEDFIEGFRPQESGNIELENGIFKKICDDAEINNLKSKNRKEILFIDALNFLLKDKIENQENMKIDLKRNNSYFNIYDYNGKTIYFEKQNGDKSHSLSVKTLEKMYYEEENKIINGGLSPYYNPILEKLLKIKKSHNSEKIERKNFYIVIDEINRGNISKIFGELITLIEEDKRDIYEVTLPYSKEKFKIPSNLYIIATMNSTDKSIATIDIALRRRFTFIKMTPNENLVEETSIKEAFELFKDLNDFISNKDKGNLGEDYKLGHSYFMNIKDKSSLNFVKNYKLKPLLEEYFYGDEDNYNKVVKILEKNNEELEDKNV